MSSLYSLPVCFLSGPESMVTVAELKSLYVDSIPRDISGLVFADHVFLLGYRLYFSVSNVFLS